MRIIGKIQDLRTEVCFPRCRHGLPVLDFCLFFADSIVLRANGRKLAMCGIFGATSKSLTFGRDAIRDLHRRGPDNRHRVEVDGCQIGFTRLAIVGVEDGQQPVRGDRGLHTVMNGEIYNFQDLRDKHGLRVLHDSDSAVLAPLYEKFGEQFVEHLDGMFAIAVFDFEKGEVSLFRDKLGKKPLYYSHVDGELYFCSRTEPLRRQLLEKTGKAPQLSPEWLTSYLAFGSGEHISASVYSGIHRVRPGETVSYKFETKKLSSRFWWSTPKTYYDLSLEDSRTPDLWNLILESTKERIPEEVSYGIQLSGGVDSSLILAALAELGQKDFTAFTLNTGPAETQLAADLAKYFDVRHEIVKIPSMPDLREITNEALASQDEPFWDGFLPSYLLNRQASSSVKVLFSGDGPDELFYGYPRTRTASTFQTTINALIALRLVRPASLALKFRRPELASYLEWAEEHRNLRSNLQLRLLSSLGQDQLSKLLLMDTQDLSSLLGSQVINNSSREAFFLSTELGIHLPQILKKVDASSMQNSVEVRSPFLSDKILNYALANPKKAYRTFGKVDLRAIAKGKLPAPHLSHKKTGFSFSTKQFLATEFKEEYREIEKGHHGLSDYLDTQTLRELTHSNGIARNPDIAGRLLSLSFFVERNQKF